MRKKTDRKQNETAKRGRKKHTQGTALREQGDQEREKEEGKEVDTM